jgi:hypothetical protein
LALPLLPAGTVVLATVSTSPFFGTPESCSAKPFSAIGWPALQVPVPLVGGSAAVVSTRLQV